MAGCGCGEPSQIRQNQRRRNNQLSRVLIFADEAGCFTFNRNQGVSRYFILCTIKMTDGKVGSALTDLRRQLAWDNMPLGEYFHACHDKQVIRDAVFETICKHDFTIQITSMEKSKAQPKIRPDRARFYKYGWLYHFKYGIRPNLPADVETLVSAAAIATRNERTAFQDAVHDVLDQTMRGRWKTDFPPASADPCVQVADYCAWAVQRFMERGDNRSYCLVESRISYNYDLFSRGTTHYY